MFFQFGLITDIKEAHGSEPKVRLDKPINRVYQMASGSKEEEASFQKHMADKKKRMAATRKIINARIAKRKNR